MSVRNTFPQQRPTLNLDFANSKTLDPRITFTRTSTATYVDEDGLIKSVDADVARFDHDPVTGECLGLLIEEQRTNLVLNSLSGYQNLFPANTTITTGIDAPDGSNSAVRITCSTSGSTLIRMNTGTLSNSITYTGSFYVRLISGDTATNNQLTSDICDGASINYLPSLITNKWVRITYSGVRGLTSQPQYNFIDLLSNNTNNYVLDFWGAQVEQGAFSTSHIPTDGTAVEGKTRNPDSVSITGDNFSDWYNQSEGTVFASFRAQSSATKYLMGISNNSSGELIYIRATASGSDSAMRDGGSDVAYKPIAYSRDINTLSKHCVSYKQNDFIVSAQGQISTVDDNCTVPTPTNISIGSLYNTAHLGGTISKLTYYPTRLTNAQLQNLTK